MSGADLAGGQRTGDGERIDSRTDSRQSTLYLYPLYVARHRGESKVYCKLEGSVFHFTGKDSGVGDYGWIKIASSGNRWDIPAAADLWKSRVVVQDLPTSESSRLLSGEVSGSIEEDPDINSHYLKYLDRAEEPFTSSRVEASFEKIVVDSFIKYEMRIARSPLGASIQPRGPRGAYRKVFVSSPHVQSGAITHRETIKSWRQLYNTQKEAFTRGGHHKAAKRAKDGVYSYGNMEQQGESVKFVDKNGEVIDETTPYHKRARVKSIDYPFCKPANFSMSKKKFNALIENSPSHILKPITTFVDSVDDLEEYSIAFILAIWRTLKILER